MKIPTSVKDCINRLSCLDAEDLKDALKQAEHLPIILHACMSTIKQGEVLYWKSDTDAEPKQVVFVEVVDEAKRIIRVARNEHRLQVDAADLYKDASCHMNLLHLQE